MQLAGLERLGRVIAHYSVCVCLSVCLLSRNLGEYFVLRLECAWIRHSCDAIHLESINFFTWFATLQVGRHYGLKMMMVMFGVGFHRYLVSKPIPAKTTGSANQRVLINNNYNSLIKIIACHVSTFVVRRQRASKFCESL